MAGLNKEIWLADIMEGFYPKNDFLMEATDMSAHVENNTINLADAGVDPNVLINNAVYPIPFATRTDNPIALPLDTLNTEGTIVRRIEEMELSYAKMQSVTRQHQSALRKSAHQRAIHAYAGASNTIFTPVIAATGAVVGGVKELTLNDLLKLKVAFDNIDAPLEGRVLVLNPIHYGQLIAEDKNLFNQVVQGLPGFMLFGFKVYQSSQTPAYNRTTGVKKALGAAAVPATDTVASVAFVGSEVMKCDGDVYMFARLNDPEQAGDIINFQKRFLAMSIRNKCIGALYSAA